MLRPILFFLPVMLHYMCIGQVDSITNTTTKTCGDIITFKNETTVKAKILEITKTDISYKRCANLSGPTITIPRQNINKIKFSNDSVVEFDPPKKYYPPHKAYATVIDTTPVISRQKNAIYGTLGLGALAEGIALNINYERHLLYFTNTKKQALTLRLGYGVIGGIGGSATSYAAVAGVQFGKHTSHFELGGGVAWLYEKDSNDWSHLPVISVGYRHQSPEKPFLFRIGLSNVEGLYLSFGSAFFKAKKK